MLRRWLGLTPERPALCLRGYPRRPRVALSRFLVILPGWVGVRDPRGRLGGLYAKAPGLPIQNQQSISLVNYTRT